MIANDYKPFVNGELEKLKAYDALRPKDHPYAFHLHVMRVARSMQTLALAMGQGETRAEELYRASLIHDAGKRLLPVHIWDVEGKPDNATKNLRRSHTSLGVQILNETFGADVHDPFLDLTRDLMAHHHEAMDGSGWLGLKGADLSLEARMLCICDAYDGYTVWRPHFGSRDISPEGVTRRMVVEKAGQFDPEILPLFIDIKAGKGAEPRQQPGAQNPAAKL